MFKKEMKGKNVLFHENTVGILGLNHDNNVPARITIPAARMEGVDKLVLFVTSDTDVYPVTLNLNDVLPDGDKVAVPSQE
mgnify:CR=1 FL=1